MAQFNLETFFASAKQFRGGKFVWWKDANHEERSNVLYGSTIANPYKGFGYAFAADLYEYRLWKPGFLLKTFKVAKATTADTDTTLYVDGSGYSHIPEVGNVLMKAPDTVETAGQSGKVTSVEFDEENKQFILTVDTAIGALTTDDILVEAADRNGDVATAAAVPGEWRRRHWPGLHEFHDLAERFPGPRWPAGSRARRRFPATGQARPVAR